MISTLIVLAGCLIISLVVFGGAQMFIPYFKILLVNFLHISQDSWDSVLSIANSMPGVFGLKVAFASGYLAGEGNWWAYLLMFGSYFVFIAVPIIFILIIMKRYHKMKQNKFMTSMLKVMRPIIAGILISIVINLGLSLIVPFVGFNDLSDKNFGALDKYAYLKDTFFKKWRYWVLLAWTLVSIPTDLILIRKFKVNTIYLILVNISLCMVLFEPWLV